MYKAIGSHMASPQLLHTTVLLPPQVARPGTAQVTDPTAWSAVPHAMGRQLWPVDLSLPPRYCAGCRGKRGSRRYEPKMHITNGMRRAVELFQDVAEYQVSSLRVSASSHQAVMMQPMR